MNKIKKIHTKDLTAADLPAPKPGWSQFTQFALSWDPSAELEDAQPAYVIEKFQQVPTSNSTILEIRWYLFLQQRGWHERSDEIDVRSQDSIDQAIELLRKKLQTK
jgi:hypothetical protein